MITRVLGLLTLPLLLTVSSMWQLRLVTCMRLLDHNSLISRHCMFRGDVVWIRREVATNSIAAMPRQVAKDGLTLREACWGLFLWRGLAHLMRWVASSSPWVLSVNSSTVYLHARLVLSVPCWVEASKWIQNMRLSLDGRVGGWRSGEEG